MSQKEKRIMKTLWSDIKAAWSELLDDIVAFLEMREL